MVSWEVVPDDVLHILQINRVDVQLGDDRFTNAYDTVLSQFDLIQEAVDHHSSLKDQTRAASEMILQLLVESRIFPELEDQED